MKKIISLQALMLMGLAIGSASSMEAYCQNGTCGKYEHRNESRDEAVAKDKRLEHSLKKEYSEIRRHFDMHHNVAEARMKLKETDRKAKKFDVKIEKDENSKTVAGIHKDSLKATSRHLHEHIDKYAREHKRA